MAIVNHWGGRVPEGLRNTWLHLLATCFTHQRDNSTLAVEIEAAAARHCPGLAPSEVAGVIRAAERRMAGEQERYFYSGARMAEMPGVSDDLAKRLKLKQILSQAERGRRRQERETCRRRAKGMVPREEYLARHDTSRRKPWEAHGYSRATWYRRGCPPPPASKTAEPARRETCTPRETPPRPQQGGLPRRRPSATSPAGRQLPPEAIQNRRPTPARPTPTPVPPALTRAEPTRRAQTGLPDLMPTAEEIALAEEIFPGVISSPKPLAAARSP